MESEIKVKQHGYWRSHSDAWKASGLTQKAYREEHGICYGSFVYQHNRMARKAERTSVRFIERKAMQPRPAVNAPRLHLILPNGIRIGIDGEMSEELLETILRAAGSLSC
ncbi:hypothetical protein E3226_003010 [Legionella geestiana]|uniref:IS66 family insertion sequence element accessory protein TnpA n=1 Tax=Legionella geestiana TaxID=45065 RepID=UPI001092CAC7|nr:hypothetical protein [Legionella geestiana]QDQ39437.1 hypothetical protein E3226_003010 [Legionella geestiana]